MTAIYGRAPKKASHFLAEGFHAEAGPLNRRSRRLHIISEDPRSPEAMRRQITEQARLLRCSRRSGARVRYITRQMKRARHKRATRCARPWCIYEHDSGKPSVDGKEDKARAREKKRWGANATRRVKTHARPITLSRQAASELKKHSRKTRTQGSHERHHEKTRGEACANLCRFYYANRFSTWVRGNYR